MSLERNELTVKRVHYQSRRVRSSILIGQRAKFSAGPPSVGIFSDPKKMFVPFTISFEKLLVISSLPTKTNFFLFLPPFALTIFLCPLHLLISVVGGASEVQKMPVHDRYSMCSLRCIFLSTLSSLNHLKTLYLSSNSALWFRSR